MVCFYLSAKVRPHLRQRIHSTRSQDCAEPRRYGRPMESTWICEGCSTRNADIRASCEVCAASSPKATPASLAATALADAAAARTAQLEVTAQGHTELAAHLGRVVDTYLDDALDLRRFTDARATLASRNAD